jgi:hypothetical protein
MRSRQTKMIGIALNWSKAHRYEAATVSGQRVIKQVGTGRDANFEPFKVEDKDPLWLCFAKLDGSEEACLRFARRFGLLTTKSPNKAETLEGWQKEIRNINRLIKALGADQETKGGILNFTHRGSRGIEVPFEVKASLVQGDVDIATGAVGRPKLLFEVPTLLAGIKFQLGKFVAGEGMIGICAQCKEPFEGRRRHAMYCSDPCKDKASYQNMRAAS